MAPGKELEEEEEEFIVFKLRADLCYYKQHYGEAIASYMKVLAVLPRTHAQVKPCDASCDLVISIM